MILPLWIISVFLPQNNPELCAAGKTGNAEIGVERGDAGRLECHGLVDGLTRTLREDQHLAAPRRSRVGLHRSSAAAPAGLPTGRPGSSGICGRNQPTIGSLSSSFLATMLAFGKITQRAIGLPQRLMIAGDDAWAVRNVLAALYPVIQPHDELQQKHDARWPTT